MRNAQINVNLTGIGFATCARGGRGGSVGGSVRGRVGLFYSALISFSAEPAFNKNELN